MKKNFFFALTFLLSMISCSSDDSTNEQKLVPAFTLESTQINVGANVIITNTSKSDSEIVSYLFDFGNEKTSAEKEPITYYSEPGEYTIKLTIKDSNGNTKTTSTKITVILDDSYFVDGSGSVDSETIPLEIGTKDDNLFLTNIYSVNFSAPKIYFSQHVYNKKIPSFDYYYFSEKKYNSGHAHTTFLNNGNKIINITQTDDSNLWGYNEINVAKNGYNFSEQIYTTKVIYGSLPNSNQYYFYGATNRQPSIETRNDAGEFIVSNIYSVIENGFIGDLIKSGNTYVAFGGKFDLSSDKKTSDFTNYQPLMLFFDENLVLTSQKVFQIPSSSENPKRWKDINGSFTIRKLSNGNFALYSQDNLIITSSTGEMIKTIKVFNNNININALIAVEDGLIISTFKKLEKYDNNGNIIKTIASKGFMTPGFIKKDNLIYFASAYNFTYENYSTIRTFFSAIDSNLTYKKHN